METGGQRVALLDLVRALDGAGIPCALIGAYAVGIRSGVAGVTEDLDVAVATTTPRGVIAAALEEAGLTVTGEYEHSLNLRHPDGEPVQIASDGLFDPAVERAEAADVAGVAVRVVRRDDLIAMKERAARDPARRRSQALRDQADVELLRGDVPDPDEGW